MKSVPLSDRERRALSDVSVDEIALRRIKNRVFATLGQPEKKAVSKTRIGLLTAAACVLVLGTGLVSSSRAPVHVATSVPATTVEMEAEGGARFVRRSEDQTERVELTDGTLRLRVHRAPGGKRVLVRVPDGEIEDLGTVFQIVVQNGATQRVAVEEGQVTVRLNDVTVTLGPGASWERSVKVATTPPPEEPRPIAVTKPRAVTSPAPPTPSAADDEDIAYLEAVQLARHGRAIEAQRSARDYLRRFPNGFRREEMVRIARSE